MSKIALSGNPSGTATYTIASPAGSTDRTLTLPDEAGTVVTSNTAIPQSQIATALNATGSAPIYACRAWVNFNGTGTVAIRASGNVSSITDNGVGDYTVNFTTALADANYSAVCSARFSTSGTGTVFPRITNAAPALTTNSVRVSSQNLADARGDVEECCVAIFR